VEKALKILILEDTPSDAELVRVEINQHLKATCTLTDNAKDFEETLLKVSFDIILSDYNLPDYSGMDALKFTRKYHPNIPFIFVSGVIGEELAVHALKQGATDYVLKSNLNKLPLAIDRAIKEMEEMVKRQDAENKKEELLKELVHKNRELKCLFNISDLIAQDNSIAEKLNSIANIMVNGFTESDKVSLRHTQ